MPGHVSIRVSDLEASVQFYLTALGPLSYKDMRFPSVVGLGSTSSNDPIPDFWLRQHTPGPQNSHAAKPTPVHVSFYVGEPKLVDEFHAAGIRAGGSDNGQPGERPWFRGYYGNDSETYVLYYSGTYLLTAINPAAYILDLDGNNIEVVCFLKHTK